MARSPAAAIAETKAREGEKFDRAVGLLVSPPKAAPSPRRFRLAARVIAKRDLEELTVWLLRRCRCRRADAEEATQEAFEKQLRNEPEFFAQNREEWWPRLCGIARYLLLEAKDSQRRIVLTDAQIEPAGRDAFDKESSALPASPAACDYTSVNPPLAEEPWSRIQIIGALQRYAHYHEKAPREIDCQPLHRLPPVATIRACFGSFGKALWEAGMRERRKRIWTQPEALSDCLSFRRRHGRWPDAHDLRWNTGELPSRNTMIRLLGSTNPGVVQQQVESILTTA